MEFRLCNIDNLKTDATQECLNKTVLKIVEAQNPRNLQKFRVHSELTSTDLTLMLPGNFTCNHCVL
jgi:hypothetical protein